MSATKSLRIDEALALDAQRQGRVEHRSINGQVEYWAKLGRAVSLSMDMADAYAVVQGLKKIKLELVNSVPVDPNIVLANLEENRAKGFVDQPITTAPFYYEVSTSKPGYLDRVETATSKKETGIFKDGEFEVV